MNSSLMVVLAILAVGLNLLVIYYIIQAATRSSDKINFMKVQIKLLIKIAQANGVTEDAIEDIVRPRKK